MLTFDTYVLYVSHPGNISPRIEINQYNPAI